MKMFRFILFLLLASFAGLSYGQKFSISPNGKTTLCKGDSIKIIAASGFSRYGWSTGSTQQYIYVRYSGTYYGFAYDSKGHKYIDSVHVSYVNPATPTIGMSPKSGSICAGDSLVIEVGKGFTSHHWSNGMKGQRIVIAPSKSGYVVLEAKDSNGCWARKTVEYKVKNCGGSSCDSIIEFWPDANLCGEHDSVLVAVKSGYTNYKWSDTVSGRTRTFKKAGLYVVTVYDSAGNTCSDSIEITQSSKYVKLYSNPNPLVICKGEKAVIEISDDYDSVWWSTGARHTNRIVVDPKKTTSYVVEAIDPYGCEQRTEFKVTVKDSCDECDDLIEWSKKSLCGTKDTVILAARSGFHKYVWSNRSHDRVIKVTEKGWYYLVAMTKDSTFCYDSVYISKGGKEIEVGSNPKNATICKGDSIELEATYGFKSYYWNVSGIKHANGIKFKPHESVKVWVEAVDEHGCGSKAYIYVTVKECDTCPDIIEPWPSSSLCGRDSVILEAKSGYKSYKWKGGVEGRILVVKKAGWYYLDFKDASGNECRDSIYISGESGKELTIKVYPSTRICKGDTVVISATEGFKSYAWNTGHKTRLFEYVAEKTKEIVVEAVDKDGCEKRVVYKLKVDTCGNSSLEEVVAYGISIHPNPVNDVLSIRSVKKIQLIRVYNEAGQLVQEFQPEQLEIEIPFSEMKAGLYHLTIINESGSRHSRVVKIQ